MVVPFLWFLWPETRNCRIRLESLWVNTYRYIFSGMNIHLPAILGFTRYQGFDPSPFGAIQRGNHPLRQDKLLPRRHAAARRELKVVQWIHNAGMVVVLGTKNSSWSKNHQWTQWTLRIFYVLLCFFFGLDKSVLTIDHWQLPSSQFLLVKAPYWADRLNSKGFCIESLRYS